jgi:hypothetical protein
MDCLPPERLYDFSAGVTQHLGITAMKKMILLFAGVGLALGASEAQAQRSRTSTTTSKSTTTTTVKGGTTSTTNNASTTSSAMATHGTGANRFGFGDGWGGGTYAAGTYGEDPATTPIQGIAYGTARFLRAMGLAAKDGADAAMRLSEVRRYEMDNWKKSLETWLEVEKINRDARIAARGRPLTQADYLRMSQMGKPRRLSPSQLNLMTGELAWPVVLESTAFDSYRESLDKLFAERSEHGRLSGDNYAKAQQTAQAMTGALREQVNTLAPVDYMAARRFLESVAYELRMPATEGEEMRTAALLPGR